MRRPAAIIIGIAALHLGSAPLAFAQEGGAGAVDALREMRADGAPADQRPSSEAVRGAWAQALRQAHVGDGAAPEVVATQSAAPAAEGSLSPALMALLGLVLAGVGAAAGWFAGRQREQEAVGRAVNDLKALGARSAPPPPMPAIEFPEPPVADVHVLARESVAEHGDLLVVEVDGDKLVLFLAAGREQASLIARLDAAPAGGWRVDEVVERVVAALRVGDPAAAAVAAAEAFPREPLPPQTTRAPGQDEDLDVLLDDLLGKVRGLKPLAKSSDEP